MNTVQLECFMEVCTCLNFSRAAENLRMTQPAVSHQINALEAELGTKLFNRTSKSVELTRDGIRFMGPASDALKILRNAKARISEKSVSEVLPLGVTCRDIQMCGVLPRVLRRIAEELPLCRPVVKIAPFMPVNVLTENETVDVIFSYKADTPTHNRILYKELKKCPVCCVCSKNSELAKFDSLKIADLQGKSIALISRQRDIPEIYKVVTATSAVLKQSQIYLCDNYECAKPLVQAGLCFCVQPDLPMKKEESLKYIPITDSSPVSFGVYYSTLKANPVLKRFIEITRSMLGGKENL